MKMDGKSICFFGGIDSISGEFPGDSTIQEFNLCSEIQALFDSEMLLWAIAVAIPQ